MAEGNDRSQKDIRKRDRGPGVGGSASWVSLFFPVHLRELFISVTLMSPRRGVAGCWENFG